MRLPRSLLLPLSLALTLLAYGLILCTDWTSYYHLGPAWHPVAADAAIVLAAFSCFEVARTETSVPVRAVAAAVGIPLTLVALLMLWYGLRRYLPT